VSKPAPRRAVLGDVGELTRLHVEVGAGRVVDEGWRSTLGNDLARRLLQRDPDLAAFVIDAPDKSGLASAAVGFIHRGLCRPGHPTGLTAHLSSLVTVPAWRRRGYATAVVSAFCQEASTRGCSRVTLYASDKAWALYKALDFKELSNIMMLDQV
jgi:ribosomal protein S18 acetylase RimI-like enzyme